MADDIAIKVDHVSKTFKLPHEKQSSVKGALISMFRSGKRSYEKQHVLRDVSFEIKKGEFFGIVGRNGSGKSTLLKMLAGIYTPTQGRVQVHGKLTPFIELGVGFNPELTGRENVFLNGALLGFNRKEMSAMYDDIVAFSEIEKFMDQKLKNYSSGMQVRLAFSIAIRAQSDILLLDEVLAVGDAAFQRKCFDYFMDLKRNKRTVILVTHDMSAVRQYCDRVIMIEKGKVVHQGSAEEVAQEYQKIFSQDTETTNTITEGKDRWGEGGLLADKTTVKTTKDRVLITTTFRSSIAIPSPVYGFTIHGPGGVNVLEGNTLRLKYPTDDVAAHSMVKIVWELPNIFANGKYDVSVACCDRSTTRFYDWLNGASSFKILKETETAGVVDPLIEITNYELKGVAG